MTLDDIIANFARLSFDAISIGYCPAGEDWARHVWSNDQFRAMFGYDDIFFKDRRIELVFDPDGLDELVAQVQPAIQRGDQSIQVEAWARRANGARFRVNANIIFFPRDDDGGRYSAAVYRDVTELRERDREAEQALIEREALAVEVIELQQRLMNAIDTLPGPLAIWDKDFRLVVCNSAFAPRLLARETAPATGSTLEDVLRTASYSGQFENAVGREEAFFEEAIAGIRSGEIHDVTPFTDGRIFQAEGITADNGDMLILSTDITDFVRQGQKLEMYAAQLEAINREMEYKAFHDDLTGLWNRRQLSERLSEAIKNTEATDEEVAVIQIDLDRFKQINDTLGHKAGDHILCEVADRLRRCVRGSDIVARLGGDEFVILVEFDDLRHVELLAERLVRELSRPMKYGTAEVRAGASVGVAHTPISEADQLLTSADIALYRAKDAGRARSHFFASSDLEDMRAQKALADDILRGLDADEFEPFFQPQVDAVSGALVGLEALVRWRHPERGVLAPIAFLETAEELGKLGDIDRRMYRKSIGLCTEADFGGKKPGLSFNISSTSLMSDDLIGVAREAGRVPFDVAFELLETIYLEEESDTIMLRLDALREAGVIIEIDDFGSGRASIVALQQIAPDRMKIDRRLVSPIVQSPESLKLVKSIVDIGHTLGIGVTAEGVESEEHARLLCEIGCDRLQGYFVSRPVAFNEILERFCSADPVRIVQ